LSGRKSGKRAGRQNGSDERVIFAVEWAKNPVTTGDKFSAKKRQRTTDIAIGGIVRRTFIHGFTE
jgi:hypothetical protein